MEMGDEVNFGQGGQLGLTEEHLNKVLRKVRESWDVYGKSIAGKRNSQCKARGKSMSGESEGHQGTVEGGKQGGRYLGDEGRDDRSVGTCKPLCGLQCSL